MYPPSNGQNPRFPNPQDFRVVQRSNSVGKGVICFRRFEPGELIAEITGKVIRQLTQHSLQIEPGLHLLDVYFAGFFLHSCDPNVSLDMKNRRVYAVKAINESDFLEMDYAETEDVLYRQFACNCGAATCRGWITGSAEKADENDAAYGEFLRRWKTVA